MALSKKLIAGASLLSVGLAISAALDFIRNVVVVRMITPEEYGIAYTFVITVAFFKMASDISTDRVVIQSGDGDNPEFQKTAQGIEVLRGTLMAALIFLLAGPISRGFDIAGYRWAFQLLALVPLINSLKHLDICVVQRKLQYREVVICETGSRIITTALAYPVCRWQPNPSALLYLLINQVLCYTIISHLLAKQRYGWRLNKIFIRYILKFGWPLILNGLLLYVISQGDRLVIAKFGYPKAELGFYALGFSLTFVLTLMINKINSSIMLPILSQCRDNPRAYVRRYRLGLIGLAGIGGTLTVVFILAGGPITAFIYGEQYAIVSKFIGWLAAMQAIRILRSTPSMAAMAKGHTRIMPWANIYRSLAFIAMLVIGYLHFDLVWIAIAGFGGEVLALIVVTYLLKRRCQIPAWCTVQAVIPPALAALAAALLIHSGWICAPHPHPLGIGYFLPFTLRIAIKLLARLSEICMLLQWGMLIVAVMLLSLWLLWRKIKAQDKVVLTESREAREATLEIMKQHLAEETHEEEL